MRAISSKTGAHKERTKSYGEKLRTSHRIAYPDLGSWNTGQDNFWHFALDFLGFSHEITSLAA